MVNIDNHLLDAGKLHGQQGGCDWVHQDGSKRAWQVWHQGQRYPARYFFHRNLQYGNIEIQVVRPDLCFVGEYTMCFRS